MGAFADLTAAEDQDLDGVRERVQHAGLDGEVHHEMSDVDVASTVPYVATQVNASLIVVGLHRRSALGKVFLGSTAERIILSAARPVLSVSRVHPVRGGQHLDHGVSSRCCPRQGRAPADDRHLRIGDRSPILQKTTPAGGQCRGPQTDDHAAAGASRGR